MLFKKCLSISPQADVLCLVGAHHFLDARSPHENGSAAHS
jgi:hypothetical protein